jgi:lipopolysaccharide/colanic/teichoic acid biosynthesis glycosyltransferase
MHERKQGIYEKYIKRLLDIVCATLAIVVFGWLYIIVAILVRVKLGSPVIFKQARPGKDEKIFYMYKFRSMTDAKDKNGNLLSDEERMTSFGWKIRFLSVDELPEAFNILKGDMSIIGPRPQLVRDMVFMTDEQRMRHTAKPGLSGLAQVNGRNNISWEDKLNWDLKYIEKVSFLGDVKIVFQTVIKAFVKQEGITDGDMATAYDYGDWLLKNGKVSQEEYDEKQMEAKELLKV